MYADSHRRHGPVERIVQKREANDDGHRHRQGAGIDDGHHRRGEQHAHGNDDEHRGEDEGVGGLALSAGVDEGDARPADAVEELGGGDFAAPQMDRGVLAWSFVELPAQADENALGDEDSGEPDEQLSWRCPEHRAHGHDDGQQRRGDGSGQLVAHEHQEEFVFERRLECRSMGELLASRPDAPFGAPFGVYRDRSGRMRFGRGASCHTQLPATKPTL